MVGRMPAGALTVATLLIAPAGLAGRQAEPPPLFASHDLLEVTLTADFGRLVQDRRASPDRPATVTVSDASGEPVDIAAELRTRGEFRLDPRNCSFPPLRLDVSRRAAVGTVFEGQDDLKIVSSCRPGRSRYDRLVGLEYAAYRLHAIVTDRAFRVRPIRMTLIDDSGERPTETRFAFLIEDADMLAERLGGEVFELEEGKNLPPSGFDPGSMVTTGLFQYMIGNTDWSAVAGHNVELIERDGVAIAVPYDFDFSGFVDAPYASPPESLGLRSVRERYYRGWCTNDFVARLAVERFRAVESELMTLVSEAPEVDDSVRGRAVRYLEEFFDDIATDQRAQTRALRHCRRVDG